MFKNTFKNLIFKIFSFNWTIFALRTISYICSMKTKWGILSTAKIGLDKVIPAIQKAYNCEVTAIASRDCKKAEAAALKLGIPKHYESYEDLLNDPDIDIIYNPLPNHLHVEWTVKALRSGKHVLCEKPIGLNRKDAEQLKNAIQLFPELKVMEAFMYRFHPQWKKTISLIKENEIGIVKSIQSSFTYYNVDPGNIRNQLHVGGGALMDIGCYCISFARTVFESEPRKVCSLIVRDEKLKTDIQTSALLDFGDGKTSQFVCSTQLMPFQRVQILGTEGRIEIEIPVNAAPGEDSFITLFKKDHSEKIVFQAVDQYTEQAIAFAHSVIEGTNVPLSIENAFNNMQVIDAVFQSEKEQCWVNLM